MSRPIFPHCVKCQVLYRPKKNGVTVELMAGFGSFELWKADLIECPSCHNEIIHGYAMGPVAIHFEKNYKEVLKKEAKISKVFKSYEKPDLVPVVKGKDGTQEVMILMKVEDDADYGVIRDSIAGFPAVAQVNAPIPVFGKEVK